MAAAEALSAGVSTLVTDYPLGRLLASKGPAMMCERSPQAIAIGIERLAVREGGADRAHRHGRCGREPLSGQSRPVLAQTEGLIRAGT